MPGWCLVFGALGTLGALAGPGSIGCLITTGGSLLVGVAFTWLGYELVSGAGAPALAYPNVDAGVSIQSS